MQITHYSHQEIPIPALRTLASILKYEFTRDPDADEVCREEFLDEVYNEEGCVFSGEFIRDVFDSSLRHPSILKIDLIEDGLGQASQQSDFNATIFVLTDKGIAFQLFVHQIFQNPYIDIKGLNTYPGERYSELVATSRKLHLEAKMRLLFEMHLGADTPVAYDDILLAFETVVEKDTRLASQRDAHQIASTLSDPETSSAARSFLPRRNSA